MAAIAIRSGMASEVSDTGAGIAFRIGTPPISVTIGAPSKRMSLGFFQPPSISENEWMAVAVLLTAWRGTGHVLLSYRRLSMRESARPANFWVAACLLALSAFGIARSVLADNFSTSSVYAACSVLLAIPCVVRLLSVRKATRLLQNWQAPV
jgi:hypothetical protein